MMYETFSFIEAILLGFVQGVIEFFPVSSSGHLIAWQALAHSALTTQLPHHKLFDAVVQMGSGAALLLVFAQLFRKKALPFTEFSFLQLARSVCISSLPVVLCGVLFYSFIKTHLYTPTIVGSMLIVGGVLFLLIEKVQASNTQHSALSQAHALCIGIFQSCALIPGVSRSGATIATARALGIPAHESVYFSFLLAIPILLGAGAYDLLKVFRTAQLSFSADLIVYLVLGASSAFFSSLFFARPLLSFLIRVGLTPFGWYRIAIGGMLLALT